MVEFTYQVLHGAHVGIYDHDVDIHEVMKAIAEQEAAQDNDDAFTVINLTYVHDRFMEWHQKLPRIQPFYAIKCNSDPVLSKVLADMGAGFDCASKSEMNETVLGGLTSPDRILYANPIKQRSFIKHAQRLGIRKMTFDNVEELYKIKEQHDDPQLILRIRVDDPTAGSNLGIKFGCDPPLEKGPELLAKAKQLGVPIVGISFHVGSSCGDPSAFREGVSDARKLFEVGAKLGHTMRIVDIGGGFPGRDSDKITFDKLVSVIRPAVDEFFPRDKFPDVEIYAEPGRFFASEPVSVVAHVIGATEIPASRITHKKEDDKKAGYMYYLNDGVYGSFNSIVFDHLHPTGTALMASNSQSSEKTYPAMIWGPTCDGLDQVEASTVMPKLGVGDWIYYSHMGAYTSVAASHFNGFKAPRPYYIMSSKVWKSLYGDKKTRTINKHHRIRSRAHLDSVAANDNGSEVTATKKRRAN